jgi:single-stranded-DNA-specific exonuclease
MQGLVQTHWPNQTERFWNKFIELVGLASVADCVPLIDENRYLAKEGLRGLATTGKHGLKALMQSSGTKISVNAQGDESLTGQSVGFRLAPRLNAAGRMASPRLALELLLSGDKDICAALAAEIEGHNQVRRERTLRVVSEAIAMVEQQVDLRHDPMIIMAGEGWEHGVIGLAATRLAERYARPAIVLGIEDGAANGSGMAKGSGRSVEGFDLGGVLQTTRHLLASGGGHAMACGLSLPVASLPEFRELALRCAREKLKADGRSMDDLVPQVRADCAVTGRHITRQLLRDFSGFEPCGAGNAEALLVLSLPAYVARLLGGEEDVGRCQLGRLGRASDWGF